MNFKVVVPKPISERIGGFGLSRGLTVRVLTAIHTLTIARYPQFRDARVVGQERYCWFRMVLAEGGATHI
ncbi:MAG TPA: hypothetical protein VE988_20820, partial [Gemmataceae bacterium]|nr:hypothetical protein [Gemmataceae bacterium]